MFNLLKTYGLGFLRASKCMRIHQTSTGIYSWQWCSLYTTPKAFLCIMPGSWIRRNHDVKVHPFSDGWWCSTCQRFGRHFRWSLTNRGTPYDDTSDTGQSNRRRSTRIISIQDWPAWKKCPRTLTTGHHSVKRVVARPNSVYRITLTFLHARTISGKSKTKQSTLSIANTNDNNYNNINDNDDNKCESPALQGGWFGGHCHSLAMGVAPTC